jgi:WD40 repeat protein
LPPRTGQHLLRCLAISPDGRTLASGSGKNVRLWDVEGKESRPTFRYAGEVRSAAFSPNGKLASGSMEDGVRLWELAIGRELPRIEEPGHVLAVRFSLDGKWLGAYGFGSGVDVIDVATGKRRYRFDDLIDFAFLPDGQAVAGWGRDGTVRFRSLADGREVHSFRGPARPNVTQLPFAFSPDGRLLGIGSFEGPNARKVELWEVATGKVRETFEGHTGAVTALAFTPDGQSLLSAS